jgi:hypothetical protein
MTPNFSSTPEQFKKKIRILCPKKMEMIAFGVVFLYPWQEDHELEGSPDYIVRPCHKTTTK